MKKPELFNLSGRTMFFLVTGLLLLGYVVGYVHGYHVGFDEKDRQDAKAITESATIGGAGDEHYQGRQL